jgi:cyclopropane fatty-acyl-phospholipid synthase-like methyltransferase
MHRTDEYDEDYFINGQELGISLYTDYRWMPYTTHRMAQTMVNTCKIREGETILDVGCARGFLVRAFRELGFEARGVDVSEWAIEHADPSVLAHVEQRDLVDDPLPAADWIIAKDVLEHLPESALVETVMAKLSKAARVGLFIVVPVSRETDAPYIIPAYERDTTHRIRWPLWRWLRLTQYLGAVEVFQRLRGIKDNYAWSKDGNAMILVRRAS